MEGVFVLRLRQDAAGRPIGTITASAQGSQPLGFSGWIDLMCALDTLLSEVAPGEAGSGELASSG
ncbi:MAG TPA: hypothetical protein VGL20_21635 [Candidatus Dormibacteraeota bacterium]|jgi:hypothetical protein